MKSRFLVLILVITISSNISYSQALRKILSDGDKKKLAMSDTIIKPISNLDIGWSKGFTGRLLVKRINHKYRSTEIGEWSRKKSIYGLDVIMDYDSTGRLLNYKEFNKDEIIIFDCTYWYETKQGKNFRLENMVCNNESGIPLTKGSRFWEAKTDKFGFYYYVGKHRFGKWEFFDNEGNVIRTKDYGDFK